MNSTSGPFRSTPIGIALQIGGKVSIILAIFTLVIFANKGWFKVFNAPAFVGFFLFLATTVFFLGPFMIRRGKSIAAPNALDIMQRDQRSPVVYLRPFDEDNRDRTAHDLDAQDDYGELGNHLVINQLNALRMLITGYFGFRDLTLEEEFNLALRGVGPMVAIGRPGEAVQTAGALRFYVSDDDWKGAIENVLAKASVVIWHAGTSQGTWWELETIVRSVDPQRVVLVVPSPVRRADAYRDLQLRSKNVLPVPLPDIWEDVNIVTFGPDWRPKCIPYNFRSSFEKYFSASGLNLHVTLDGFLQRLGQLPGTEHRPQGDQTAWTTSNSIEVASIVVAILLAVGIHSSGVAVENRVTEQRNALQKCQNMLSSIREFSSQNNWHPARWSEFVVQARTALAATGGLDCAGGNSPGIAATFEQEIPDSAKAQLPRWETLVSDGGATVDEVSGALVLLKNSSLLEKWRTSVSTLEAARYKNTVVVSINIVYPDWAARTMEWDSSRMLDLVERQVLVHLRSAVREHERVLSARRVPAEELKRFTRHVDINLNVEVALYESKAGSAGTSDKSGLSANTLLMIAPAIPEALGARVSIKGASTQERNRSLSIRVRAEPPKSVAMNEVRQKQDAAFAEMIERVMAKIEL